jgi:uroporphyrinogen decarboxylase
MTRRERVIACLEHRQPDRVPYHITFTQPARQKMATWYGDADFEAGLGNCLLILETDPRPSHREAGPDIWEDRFGVRWDRSIDQDIGTVCNRAVAKANLAEYPFPDPEDPTRFEGYERRIREAGDRFVLARIAFSLFERAWSLAGMENVLMAMLADKPFVNGLLDRILAFNLRIIEKACSYPIDGMRFGDDWGQQRGLLMGPELWREFIKPRIREMFQLVKSKGKRVFLHCCGKVDELFPELVECGLDVFNPFQPEVMDVFEMKRLHGDRLSFHGGISTQRTLPYGTVEQVKAEVRALIERVGRNGGYIASPAHDVPKDAKAENIAAMIEVLKGQG